MEIFQGVSTDEKGFIVSFRDHTLFSLLAFHEIPCYWCIIWELRFFLFFYLRAFHLTLFSFHRNTP